LRQVLRLGNVEKVAKLADFHSLIVLQPFDLIERFIPNKSLEADLFSP